MKGRKQIPKRSIKEEHRKYEEKLKEKHKAFAELCRMMNSKAPKDYETTNKTT